jgi:hypothetical protein
MFFWVVAGTAVVMAGGAIKNIEDVHIGDTVRSYDERHRKRRFNGISQNRTGNVKKSVDKVFFVI